jgi:hypothetical protein
LTPDEEPGTRERSPEIAALDDNLEAIRGALGEEAFIVAWDAGRALSLEEALRLALSSASR